jgi:hypothetical protein
MAKKRKISKAVGNAAESQVARLIGAATDKVDGLVSRAARSANTSKRRTYILAALAALMVAGQAAARMRAAMRKAPAAQPVRLKASRSRKRK